MLESFGEIYYDSSMSFRSTFLVLAGAAINVVGCAKKSTPAGPPPASPATGAPIVFQVTKVTPGDKHNGVITVNAYNFSEKSVAGYSIMYRFKDQAGARIKLNVGTAFEKDFDSWSMQSPDMLCKPKSWCSFAIDHLDVPVTAVNADVIADRVRAIAPDGVTFEPDAIWELSGSHMEWPASMP